MVLAIWPFRTAGRRPWATAWPIHRCCSWPGSRRRCTSGPTCRSTATSCSPRSACTGTPAPAPARRTRCMSRRIPPTGAYRPPFRRASRSSGPTRRSASWSLPRPVRTGPSSRAASTSRRWKPQPSWRRTCRPSSARCADRRNVPGTPRAYRVTRGREPERGAGRTVAYRQARRRAGAWTTHAGDADLGRRDRLDSSPAALLQLRHGSTVHLVRALRDDRRPLLGDQGQYVVGGHRLAVLVGHVRVPAHLAVPGVLARDDLLACQRHGQLVARVDRREEAQVLQAVVGQHGTGIGLDEQPGREEI